MDISIITVLLVILISIPVSLVVTGLIARHYMIEIEKMDRKYNEAMVEMVLQQVKEYLDSRQ